MDKVGKYQFLAEPFHCDFSKRLFMGHLGNHMLNAADFHSTDRGFGMQYLMTIERSSTSKVMSYGLRRQTVTNSGDFSTTGTSCVLV